MLDDLNFDNTTIEIYSYVPVLHFFHCYIVHTMKPWPPGSQIHCVGTLSNIPFGSGSGLHSEYLVDD